MKFYVLFLSVLTLCITGADKKVIEQNFADFQRMSDSEWLQLVEAKDVDAVDKEGRTLLMFAAYYGKPLIVKRLLEKKALVNAQDQNLITVLHFAAFNGDLDSVQQLIAAGALVNVQDNQGLTPLHVAQGAFNNDVVDHLLQQGADKNNLKDSEKINKLMFNKENLEKVSVEKILVALQKGFDVFEVDKTSKKTFIESLWKAKENNPRAKKFSKDDWSRLIETYWSKDKERAKKARDSDRLSFLHYAAVWATVDFFKSVLVEMKNFINDQSNTNKVTPLYLAAYFKRADIVDYLMSQGANLDVGDVSGIKVRDMLFEIQLLGIAQNLSVLARII